VPLEPLRDYPGSSKEKPGNLSGETWGPLGAQKSGTEEVAIVTPKVTFQSVLSPQEPTFPLLYSNFYIAAKSLCIWKFLCKLCGASGFDNLSL
jgi:hypothetical protein